MVEKEELKTIKGTVDAITDKYGGGINVSGAWINGVDISKFKKGSEVELKVKSDKSNRLQLAEIVSNVEKPQGDTTDFPTILDKAHKMGILSIETVMLDHDKDKKSAVFKATVKMKNGMVSQAHGDADPINSTKEIAEHYIRFAETRAIARALRWVTNEGRAVKEEMKKENAYLKGDEFPDPIA